MRKYFIYKIVIFAKLKMTENSKYGMFYLKKSRSCEDLTVLYRNNIIENNVDKCTSCEKKKITIEEYLCEYLKAKIINYISEWKKSDYKNLLLLSHIGKYWRRLRNFTLSPDDVGMEIIDYMIKYNIKIPYFTCEIKSSFYGSIINIINSFNKIDYEYIKFKYDSKNNTFLLFLKDYKKMETFENHKSLLRLKLTSPKIYGVHIYFTPDFLDDDCSFSESWIIYNKNISV